MTTQATPLLLITKDPDHPLASLALRYAQALLEHPTFTDAAINEQPLQVFFYADAAHIANRLRWQAADQLNLTQQWQTLAEQYSLPLPVCVSTALSRGISDADNSTRHLLAGENIATGFELVGLSELAMTMQRHCRLIAF